MKLTEEMEIVINAFCIKNKKLKDKIISKDPETIKNIGRYGNSGMSAQEVIEYINNNKLEELYEEAEKKYLAKKIYCFAIGQEFAFEVSNKLKKMELDRRIKNGDVKSIKALGRYGTQKMTPEEILIALNNNKAKDLYELAINKQEALLEYFELIKETGKKK